MDDNSTGKMATVGVLESGGLGFFWPLSEGPPDLETEPERGYLRSEQGWAVLDALDEDPLATGFGEAGESPAALAGVMRDDAVLLLELQQTSATKRFGGDPRASSKTYRARTVIGHTPVHLIESPSVLGLHGHIPGIGR